MSLLETYKAVCRQGVMPIFVKDDFDTEKLLEACLKAKLEVIEYTLRREDANLAIPQIIKDYPNFKLLIGSTLDSDKIILKQKEKHKQLMTFSELAELGVQGFVSMFEFSDETIKQYCHSHLLIPSANTSNDAFRMMKSGAHFIKMLGPDLTLVERTRNAPSHGFCPIFVSGGMNEDTIPATIEAGAACVAAGFDGLLKDKPTTISTDEIADILVKRIEFTRKVRKKIYPELMELLDQSNDEWLNYLPHYHPF